jgi:hypothetical protein
VDLADALNILVHLLANGAAPTCLDAADADDSGELNTADAMKILNILFLEGAEPPDPGSRACGPDPTADDLEPCTGPCR